MAYRQAGTCMYIIVHVQYIYNNIINVDLLLTCVLVHFDTCITFFYFTVEQNPDSHANDSRFSLVAALHSEILLVGAGTGSLYSWPCRKGVVNPQQHSLRKELGLTQERIIKISSSGIRCSLVTESGTVATFYDSLIRGKLL